MEKESDIDFNKEARENLNKIIVPQFVCKKKKRGRKKPSNALFFRRGFLNDIFFAKGLSEGVEEVL